MPLILVVEDDQRLRRILAEALESGGYDTAEVGDGETALKAADELKPDLILLDLKLPGISGIDVMDRLGDHHPPVIVMSGYVDKLRDDLHHRAAGFIEKPMTVDELIKEVEEAFRESGTGNALLDTKEELDARAKALERYKRNQGA